MDGKTVDKGSDYTVLPNAFPAPDDTQEFDTWEVDGQRVAPGTSIKVKDNTVIKALWKDKTTTPGEDKPKPGDNDKPGTEPGTEPGTTPGTEPGTEPGTTPAEPTPETPTEPGGDSSKPEDKKPEDKTPAKPAEGDKIVKKGDTETVVPKEVLDMDKGKLSPEDRTKIEEKLKERNPDIVDVKVDEKGNAHITFSDGRKEILTAKDLSDAAGIKIPKKHSEDSLSKKAGKNAKTGIESIAGLVCTLVASTGALYIGRKKED